MRELARQGAVADSGSCSNGTVLHPF